MSALLEDPPEEIFLPLASGFSGFLFWVLRRGSHGLLLAKLVG